MPVESRLEFKDVAHEKVAGIIFTWYHIIRNCYTKLLWIMGACCAFDFPQLPPQQSLAWKLSACFICSQEQKKGKKVKKEKHMLRSSLEAPMPFHGATACFMAAHWNNQQGHVVLWHWARWAVSISSRPRTAIPQLCPATAICSFNLHSLQLTSVPYLQQRTLHKAHYSSFSPPKQAAALKAPATARSCAIRAWEPVGNERPWGSEGRVFLSFLHLKLQHKAPS